MPFILVQDNGAEEDDERFLHAKHATFGMQGPSVLLFRDSVVHPMLRACMATPQPMERVEPGLPRMLTSDNRAFRPRPSPCQRIRMPPSTSYLTALELIFRRVIVKNS
jgi:hypothetical protein